MCLTGPRHDESVHPLARSADAAAAGVTGWATGVGAGAGGAGVIVIRVAAEIERRQDGRLRILSRTLAVAAA
jgi:hypothetical protein